MISCKRREMLRMNSDDYKRWADEVEDGFKHAARFLMTEKVFDAKFLPYATQLVPLAAIFVALGGRREDVAVRDRIARWYWYGVFGALLDTGLVDVTRTHLPDPGTYSWWSYRPGQFEANRGLRIDLVLCSLDLAPQVRAVVIDLAERADDDLEEKPSDHAPVIVDLCTVS